MIVFEEKEAEIYPFQLPRDFTNIDDFEAWLHDEYSPFSFCKSTGKEFTFECWGIFSEDGVLEKCYEVEIPRTIFYENPKLTEEIEGNLRRKILSHNHPSNTTFSIYDVCTWANLEMIEIRVVTDAKRYSIKSIGMRWPTPKSIIEEILTKIPIENLKIGNYNKEKCLKNLANKKFFNYSEISTPF